jgi:hypothetical protein
MSLRAIARMKREIRELRAELSAVKTGSRGTRVSRLILTSVQDAEINTAHRLGYITVLRNNHDGSFGVHALSLRDI